MCFRSLRSRFRGLCLLKSFWLWAGNLGLLEDPRVDTHVSLIPLYIFILEASNDLFEYIDIKIKYFI